MVSYQYTKTCNKGHKRCLKLPEILIKCLVMDFPPIRIVQPQHVYFYKYLFIKPKFKTISIKLLAKIKIPPHLALGKNIIGLVKVLG